MSVVPSLPVFSRNLSPKNSKTQVAVYNFSSEKSADCFLYGIMDKFRYWRQERATLSRSSKKTFEGQGTIGLIVFWYAVISVALSLSAFLFYENINSVYNLPGGPWSEPVYWQEHVKCLRFKAVASVSWKRTALFILSGERLGSPALEEFPQLRAFEVEDLNNDHLFAFRGSPWLDNLFTVPCILLIGRRFTNILLIWGSLLSNVLAMAFLLKVLGRSRLSIILGAGLYILNPLNIAALSALNWAIAYSAWGVWGFALIVKIGRGEKVKVLQLGIVLILAAVFNGWVALFLLVGIIVAVKHSKNPLDMRCFSIKTLFGIATIVYLASATLEVDLRWLNTTNFVLPLACETMAFLTVVGLIDTDIFSKREWLLCISCFVSLLLLTVFGKYGILIGGIVLSLWWVVQLSLLPERCHLKHRYGTSIIALTVLLFSILGVEQSQLAPLPGFNSHIAPSYFLLSHVTEGQASILELPLVKQPLYLFAQVEHGLKLVSEKKIRPHCDSCGYQLLYGFITKLDRGDVQQSYEYKQLAEDKKLCRKAWRQLRDKGVNYLILHERGCNWAELQRGAVSGATYAQDYLALMTLCGAPILEDYEPLSRGRWGWPQQDWREINWYRIAVFKVPPEDIDSRKNRNSL